MRLLKKFLLILHFENSSYFITFLTEQKFNFKAIGYPVTQIQAEMHVEYKKF